MGKKSVTTKTPRATGCDYSGLVGGIDQLLETARRASARAVNAFMTATYWEIGRRIVEFEQGGADRAKYGGGAAEATFGRSGAARWAGIFVG